MLGSLGLTVRHWPRQSSARLGQSAELSDKLDSGFQLFVNCSSNCSSLGIVGVLHSLLLRKRFVPYIALTHVDQLTREQS